MNSLSENSLNNINNNADVVTTEDAENEVPYFGPNIELESCDPEEAKNSKNNSHMSLQFLEFRSPFKNLKRETTVIAGCFSAESAD